MSFKSPKRERAQVLAAVKAAIETLPPHERIHLLVKLLMAQDPDQVPVAPDGRRMNAEEARRRLAQRRDRR